MNFNIQRGKWFIVTFFLLLSFWGWSNTSDKIVIEGFKNFNGNIKENTVVVFKDSCLNSTQKLKLKIVSKIRQAVGVNRGTALLILLLTGPLGGHRVYLGTSIYVPLVYTATVGGGFGILPLIDAFVILFTPDLSKFINNDKVIMWIN